MSTTWVIECSDGRTAEVVADQIRVVDGALMLGPGESPPPTPLRIVAVFASHLWRRAYPAETPIVWRDQSWGIRPPSPRHRRTSSPRPPTYPTRSAGGRAGETRPPGDHGRR